MKYSKSLAIALLLASAPLAIAQPQLSHNRAFFTANGTLENNGITVSRGEVQPVQDNSRPTAAYMEIENANPTPDRLTGASCDWVNGTSIVNAGGAQLQQVEVPPHGHVVLSEKGPHLLLKSVTWPIYNGDTTVCDLRFEHAGTVPVAVDATPQN